MDVQNEIIKEKFCYLVYAESYKILTNLKKMYYNQLFSNLGQLGTKIVKRLKNLMKLASTFQS